MMIMMKTNTFLNRSRSKKNYNKKVKSRSARENQVSMHRGDRKRRRRNGGQLSLMKTQVLMIYFDNTAALVILLRKSKNYQI